MKMKDKIKYKIVQSGYKPGKSKIVDGLKIAGKMEKAIEDVLAPKKKKKNKEEA